MNEAVRDAKNNLNESGLSDHPTATNIVKEVDILIATRDEGLSPFAVNELLGTPETNTKKYAEQEKLLRVFEKKLPRELEKLKSFIKDFRSLKDVANLASSVKEGRIPF